MNKKILIGFVFLILFSSFTSGYTQTEIDDLQTDILLYTAYDGDATDSSPNSYNGTPAGTPSNSVSYGILEEGYDFDGTDDTITYTNRLSGLDDGGSVSVWFNADSTNSAERFVFNHYDGTARIMIIQQGSTIFGKLGGETSNTTTISTGTWYHAVLTWDGSNNGKFYIDGSLVNSWTYTSNSALADNYGVGGFIYDSGILNWWDGQADELGIWDRVLTSDEVEMLYNDGDALNPYTAVESGADTIIELTAINKDTGGSVNTFSVNVSYLLDDNLTDSEATIIDTHNFAFYNGTNLYDNNINTFSTIWQSKSNGFRFDYEVNSSWKYPLTWNITDWEGTHSLDVPTECVINDEVVLGIASFYDESSPPYNYYLAYVCFDGVTDSFPGTSSGWKVLRKSTTYSSSTYTDEEAQEIMKVYESDFYYSEAVDGATEYSTIYSTTNGTIEANISTATTYEAEFYYGTTWLNTTYSGQTDDLEAELYQSIIYLYAEDGRGNALTNFNLTGDINAVSENGLLTAYKNVGTHTSNFFYSDLPPESKTITTTALEVDNSTFIAGFKTWDVNIFDIYSGYETSGYTMSTFQYDWANTGAVYGLTTSTYSPYDVNINISKSGYSTIQETFSLDDPETLNYVLFKENMSYIEIRDVGGNLIAPQSVTAQEIKYIWESGVCVYASDNSPYTDTGILKLTDTPLPQDDVVEGESCKIVYNITSPDYLDKVVTIEEGDLTGSYIFINTTLASDTYWVTSGFNYVDNTSVTNFSLSVVSSFGTDVFNSNLESSVVTDFNRSNPEYVNLTISAPGFITRTFTDVLTNSNYNAYLYPNKLTLNIKDFGDASLITGAIVSGGINDTLTTGSDTYYLNANNYTLDFSASGYNTISYDIELTGGETETLNAYMKNGFIYITALDENNASINNFNLTGVQSSKDLGSNYTTGGTASLELSTGTSATITIDAPGFAYKEYTFTPSNTSTYYNFDLVEENSVDVNIYNISAGSLITENITIQLVGTDSGLYYTTNGTYNYRNLTPGSYDFIFTGTGFTTKSYSVTIGSRSYQTLNAYLSSSTSSSGGSTTTSSSDVLFTFKDKDSGNLITGVNLAINTKVNGTYTLIDSLNSDITGRIQITDALGDDYYFIASKDDYQDKNFSLEPVIFNTYVVYLTKNSSSQSSVDGAGVQMYLTPRNFYSNSTQEVAFTIANPDGKLQSYGFNLTYGATEYQGSGVNVYGEVLSYNLSIPATTSLTDTITIKYYYTLSDQEYKEFTETFLVNNVAITTIGTHWYNKGNTYDLDLLTRVLVVLLITIALGGVAFMFNGIVGAGVVSLFVMGYFTYMTFLSAWITIPTMIGLFLLTAGGLTR